MMKRKVFDRHAIGGLHRGRIILSGCSTGIRLRFANSRHFLAVSCQASMIEAGRDHSHRLVFGSEPPERPQPPNPTFRGSFSLVMERPMT
jgi:hypothetical protein